MDDSGAARGASMGTEAFGARAIFDALRLVVMGVRSSKSAKYLHGVHQT